MFHNCKNSDEAKTLYRRLAKILHPDKGGYADLMALMQDAYELFLYQLKRSDEELEELFKFKAKAQPEKAKKTETPVAKNKYNGKYQEVEEFVDSWDEERITVFDQIFAYAKTHKSFDPRFVTSVYETLEADGIISAGAYNSCLKVYYAFRMGDWYQKFEAENWQNKSKAI